MSGRKVQIQGYIPVDQNVKLRATAKVLGRHFADLVREGLELVQAFYEGQHSTPLGEIEARRAQIIERLRRGL